MSDLNSSFDNSATSYHPCVSRHQDNNCLTANTRSREAPLSRTQHIGNGGLQANNYQDMKHLPYLSTILLPIVVLRRMAPFFQKGYQLLANVLHQDLHLSSSDFQPFNTETHPSSHEKENKGKKRNN